MTVTIKGVKLNFCWIPNGSFVMGSPANEEGRHVGEILHPATLTRGFWMAQTPTTQELWQVVVGANPSRFKGHKSLPVENVSWLDCNAFVERLNASRINAPTDFRFALPTEAQWEYACRAGSTGAYNVLGASLDALGWNLYNTAAKTCKVGQKKPNAWGLYDMHGDVWEWCQDWFDPNFYKIGAAVDPQGPVNGSWRVLRGGCWNSEPAECRCAYRYYGDPSLRSGYVGFRLALIPR